MNKTLKELEQEFIKLPKIYILECYSKHGVDYKLFKLDKPPTKKQTLTCLNVWLDEYKEMSGMSLKDIKESGEAYVMWYGEEFGKAEGQIPSGL
tara:strand:- start:386 stop:667 length:282 start_codon:yes stop_codon:yes gene_type:complete